MQSYICVSERVKLKRTDYPLVVKILQGPCEQVCKIFLMEQDLGEEINYEVSVFSDLIKLCIVILNFNSSRDLGLTAVVLHDTRWRNTSNSRCLCCRALSPSWRKRRTERYRSWKAGVFHVKYVHNKFFSESSKHWGHLLVKCVIAMKNETS